MTPETSARTHESVLWNPTIEGWYCPKCGRTSDHITIEDARVEIQQFECVFAGHGRST